jgi:DNA-binding NtrC family response regulator
LVLGETGAGKEGVAEAIHRLSKRSAGPMAPLNCAVLSGDLASSELFGHERGAFTGAERRRIGVFERARGGTVFLDEVGELAPRVQGRLLRLLETRTVQRLGAEQATPCDFRLVAATHRNLASDVVDGRFRRDLFYRIGVIVLVVPPLRQRPDDIELLATKMLSEAAPGRRWSRAAMRELRARPWPGNVRELRNLVGRVAVLTDGPLIGPEHLHDSGAALLPPAHSSGAHPSPGRRHPAPVGRSLSEIRAQAIRDELERQQGNVTRAAHVLGVARSTVYSVLHLADATAAAAVQREAVAC